MNSKVKSVDIFVQSAVLPKIDVAGWKLTDVFNRGTRVGPEGKISCHMTDVFQCRLSHESGDTNNKEVVGLLQKITEAGVVWSELHLIWADL